MTFMQHIQLLKLKLEKILTITNIQYMEWQSGTKLEKNSGEESINKCILREAMYHARNRNWGTLLCMLTLSSVVGHQNQICLSVDR